MPFIDKVVFSREKESIPYWNKFLQGYYDVSGIGSDTFDQAVQFSVEGDVGADRRRWRSGHPPADLGRHHRSCYLGFNLLDPVVGGNAAERARKLRQAISIAIDLEEFISIFRNGRGIAGAGADRAGHLRLPRGRGGHQPGDVYDWVDGKPQRKSIEEAQKLLAEAGYPDGRDAKTGAAAGALPRHGRRAAPATSRAFDWSAQQFEKLVDPARDPRHRLEPLPGEDPQGQRRSSSSSAGTPTIPIRRTSCSCCTGRRAARRTRARTPRNYVNPEFDRLFERMKNMPNSPERQAHHRPHGRDRARATRPGSWGFHPQGLRPAPRLARATASRTTMARNNLKYLRIDPASARAMRARVEPAGALAGRADRAAAGRCSAIPAVAALPAARARMAATCRR